ncbi:MAG: DUF4126 domain-containing protein [Flavobacteriales bacterium]|nr:DUF4126 domain-containing protein [Flavobacteriales bacterium]
MENVAHYILPILLGISLAAACGLRVFLPLFITSLLTHFDLGGVGLREGFGWMGEWPALIAFGVATVLELLAYSVPFLDHLLDSLAVPMASIAGTLVAASAFVDTPPLFTWSLALIAGGGVAGLISAGTAATRVASTTTTAGLGNPLFALLETGGSLLLSVLAWFLPVVAALLVIATLWLVWRFWRGVRGTH